MQENWQSIQVRELQMNPGDKPVVPIGTEYPVRVRVFLGRLAPEDVQVELYYGVLDPGGHLVEPHTEPMLRERDKESEGLYVYYGMLPCAKSGSLGFNVRIVPKHPLLVHPVDVGLVIWA